MSHNDEQIECRVVIVAWIFLLRSVDGAEKVRVVQMKGEAVEGELRTTRQAAEKSELSVEGGERARKRVRLERVNRVNHGGVSRVERTVEWVPRGVSFESPELCQVRNRPRPMATPIPSRRTLSLIAVLRHSSPSLPLSLNILPFSFARLSSFPSADPPRRRTRYTLAAVRCRRGIMEILNQFENQ